MNEVLKMKKKIINVVLIFVFSVSAAFSQYQITNSVISSGGTTVSNASYNLSSTIGESFIGKSSNTINQNQTGFWYVYQQTTVTDVEDEETIPTVFKLEQNYPNPFNPSTTIKFAVPERSNVLVKVYDILGSEVATLVNEELDAGWYRKTFNANNYSSGVYLFRMEAGKFISTKKMILLR
jgi:hypothetical protein